MPLGLLSGLFSQELAVDLGSVNALLFVRGRGVVVREPALVALVADGRGDRRVVAWGQQARALLGRAPPEVQVVRPLRDGAIADFEVAEALLRLMIHEAMGVGQVVRPSCVVSVPYGMTEVERRAVRECAEAAGAREVHLVDETLAAAIGAGLDVTQARGSMVVDVGGGSTDAAVCSLGGIVYARGVRVGGDDMDRALVDWMKEAHGLLVGPVTAEEIKLRLGSAAPGAGDELAVLEVRGRDLASGFPRAVRLGPAEVREALAGVVRQVVEALMAALDRTPPELAADIVDTGIVLTGGAAQLRRLDRALGEATGLPVILADDPAGAVATGAGALLERGGLRAAVAG